MASSRNRKSPAPVMPPVHRITAEATCKDYLLVRSDTLSLIWATVKDYLTVHVAIIGKLGALEYGI
jgi:hypothetical protein